MDQAEPSSPQGQPGKPQPQKSSRQDPRADPLGDRCPDAGLDHPVVVGYDGSASSRNALAYAAGVSRRLARPMLVVHVTPGVYCEPLTGQVIGLPRARSETEGWLLAELDQVCDRAGLEVHLVTRRGNPARELAAVADHFSADALVIGAPGHRWHQLAGSVPGWLARHAHCPVIVVP
jgi:nucleotide-binding universal stress UspA family protein